MRQGTHVTVLNSLRAAFGYDHRIEVLDTLGQAAVGSVAQSQLVLSTASGIHSEKPLHSYHQRYADAYRTEILRFADAVQTGQTVSPDAFDGLRALEWVEAAILSMTEKRPVALYPASRQDKAALR